MTSPAADVTHPHPHPHAEPDRVPGPHSHPDPDPGQDPDPAGEGYVDTPWAVLADYQCFGCSPHNGQGLRLRFRARPDGLATDFTLGSAHESYPGVVHGGLLGVICDETMGNLIVLRTGRPAFTTGLRLRDLAPVPVGATHECRARLAETSPASGLIRAEADVLDAAGALVATAHATYRPFVLDQARDRLTLSDGDADRLAHALAGTARTAAPAGTVSAPAAVSAPVTEAAFDTAPEES